MTLPGQPPPPTARLRPGGRRRLAPSRGLRRRLLSPRASAAHSADTGPDVPPMREWHQITPAERATAWAELVEWTVWLHDRYELATEERLPRCWPQHPGLIEELWALRGWRLAIYIGDGSPAAGQAARYWHGELRQVIAAATSVYAAGCRASHRSAMTVDVAAPGARET